MISTNILYYIKEKIFYSIWFNRIEIKMLSSSNFEIKNPTEIEKTSTEADTSNDSSSVPTTSTTTTTKSDTKLNKILLLSSLTETTSSTLLEDNVSFHFLI